MSTPKYSRRHIEDFPNSIFIESGSFRGDGIQDAINAGFKEIHSVEIVESFYKYCKNRFKNLSYINLYHGSSINLFPQILEKINKQITFWLDGHYSGGKTGYDKNWICPLLKELDIIKTHPIKTHTILIDDRRLMVVSKKKGMDGLFDITEQQVISKLKDINPNYHIRYLDGHISNDIIVAHL